VNRPAQAILMLLLGATVVKISATDAYLHYVKPGLQPLLIAAGLILAVAGATGLCFELRDLARTPIPHATNDEGHEHREPRVAWLLVLPVLAVLLIAPPPLGSYTAAQTGSVLTGQEPSSDYGPLPAGDPVHIGLLDYAGRAVFDHGRSLTGRNLELSGFLTPQPQGPALARIVVSCCAADGRPIKIGLSGNTPTGLADGSWIQVTGTYEPTTTTDPINGAVVPYLHVSTWRQIPVPDQPYEQ
jgi:uncharacterized repeat protein (TIGR03943 family)